MTASHLPPPTRRPPATDATERYVKNIADAKSLSLLVAQMLL